MALVLKHQTALQFLARLRQDYRDSQRARTAHLAYRIIGWVQDGTITTTQIRTAFGLTSAQWTTLRDKMIALVNARNALRGAVGE